MSILSYLRSDFTTRLCSGAIKELGRQRLFRSKKFNRESQGFLWSSLGEKVSAKPASRLLAPSGRYSPKATRTNNMLAMLVLSVFFAHWPRSRKP
ncbi:hypothetical protein CPSG_08122 [Coccidioides posadasii str. Silveira]|uniref:Uncharacterized protein n=1 Tax=Coccidioides posadasii (strain RMSCC 757 / Silveira) TaxID=443226 RepID=E9DDG0_COCPS|nr:hypothetical protein CPSG_08122 [Coccidioides posadasii str. Silveira]